MPLLVGQEEDARSVQAKLTLRSRSVALYIKGFLLRGVVSLIPMSFPYLMLLLKLFGLSEENLTFKVLKLNSRLLR